MSRGTWKQGHLEKLHTADGWCWYLRYRDVDKAGNAIRPRVRVGLVSDYPTRRDAQKAARHVRDAINSPAVQATRTFGDVIAKYLLKEIPQNYSTQRNYRRMLRLYIEPKWEHVTLADVDAEMVRDWLNAQTVSPRTKAHIHGLMKTLFRFAMLWKWYPQGENPMGLFKIKGGSKRTKDPRVLTPEQFEKLMEYIKDEPVRTMVYVAVWLGLRCSEIVGLKWRRFNFLDGQVFIDTAVVEGRAKGTKTEDSEALLPLAPELAAILTAYRAVAIVKGQDDWVFAAPRKPEKPISPYNLQQLVLRPMGKVIGLDFPLGWHTFRHTYSNWTRRVGGQAAVRKNLMRHADIRTTDNVYGKVEMDELREVNARVVGLVRVK